MAFPILLWGLGAAGAAAATLIAKAFQDDAPSVSKPSSASAARRENVERDLADKVSPERDHAGKLRDYLRLHDVKCDGVLSRQLAGCDQMTANRRNEFIEFCSSRFEETQIMLEAGKGVRSAKARVKKTEKVRELLREEVDSCGHDASRMEKSK